MEERIQFFRKVYEKAPKIRGNNSLSDIIDPEPFLTKTDLEFFNFMCTMTSDPMWVENYRGEKYENVKYWTKNYIERLEKELGRSGFDYCTGVYL